MVDNRLFYVGIKGLIQNQAGEYLLLLADVSTHKKNVAQYWDIPGGRMRDNEDFESTLKRELAEETGVESFSNPQMIATVLSNHSIPYENDGMAGLVLVVYRVEVSDDIEITLSDEHETYEWVSPSEAKERLAQKYPNSFTDTL